MIQSNNHRTFTTLPPLSLYVHIPWCVRKCPYCDFNSHAAGKDLPIKDYTAALIQDLKQDAHLAQNRKLHSIFFGGGTPSLFPASAIGELIQAASNHIGLSPDVEITLEANPGTTEHDSFSKLLSAGINRLSVGVQSFNSTHLQTLGRIHSSENAITAIKSAQDSGFSNINIDLMHGLPGQTLNQALSDLEQAINLNTPHLSWYQLTIEPNTEFYSSPPILPNADSLWNIQREGSDALSAAGFNQYEVSAFCRSNKSCKHNTNYWEFGDYIGIGAGAHGKITQDNAILRTNKSRLPADYMGRSKQARFGNQTTVEARNLPLEFMMNCLRLCEGVPAKYFTERTGIALSSIAPSLNKLAERGLMQDFSRQLATTQQGFTFLDSVLQEFVAD